MNSSCTPSTSADIGRISVNTSRGIEKLTMMCPMMVWGKGATRRPTMSLRQCVDRIGLKNPCTRHCQEIATVLAGLGTNRKEVEKIWGECNQEWVSWVSDLRKSERHG